MAGGLEEGDEGGPVGGLVVGAVDEDEVVGLGHGCGCGCVLSFSCIALVVLELL